MLHFFHRRQLLVLTHAAVAFLSFLALAYCGAATSTQDPASAPDSVPTVSPGSGGDVEVLFVEFELAPAGTTVLESLLARVPDVGDVGDLLSFASYRPVREVRGIDLPGEQEPAEAGRQYALEMMTAAGAGIDLPIAGRGPWLSGFNNYAASFNTYPYMGFDQRSVDYTIEVIDPQSGNATLELVVGRYDPSGTARTLAGCDECAQPETIEYAGVSYYRWRGDSQRNLALRLQAPLFDHIGRAGLVLVDSSAVARAFRASDIELLIDVTTGALPSLRDDLDYSMVARGLETLRALSGIITRLSFAIDNRAGVSSGVGTWPAAPRIITELGPESARDYALSAPLLKPFVLFGSAAAYDGERTFTAVAILHEDEDVAVENAVRLVNRIRDGQTSRAESWSDKIDRVEVGTVGRLLLARLYPVRPGEIFIQSPDVFSTLVVHE